MVSAWPAALFVGLATGLRLSCHPRLPPPRCCASKPPPLGGATGFQRGALDVAGTQAWWRQGDQVVQVIVALPEDVSFKRDMSIEMSRTQLSLTMSGVELLVGPLAFEVEPDESDWIVEDELDEDFFTGDRFLVIDLKKKESFVDWGAVLAGGGGASAGSSPAGAEKRLVLGGEGEVQKRATAQQLASYQVLQKLPSAVRADVYARAPQAEAAAAAAAAEDGEAAAAAAAEAAAHGAMRLYFVGKVVAEGAADVPAGATQDAALAAQEVCPSPGAHLPTLAPGSAAMQKEHAFHSPRPQPALEAHPCTRCWSRSTRGATCPISSARWRTRRWSSGWRPATPRWRWLRTRSRCAGEAQGLGTGRRGGRRSRWRVAASPPPPAPPPPPPPPPALAQPAPRRARRPSRDARPARRWAFPPPVEAGGAPLPAAGACGFEPETAPPAHMGAQPLSVRRDAEGRPLREAFQANVMKPDQVPGAYEAWLRDQ